MYIYMHIYNIQLLPFYSFLTHNISRLGPGSLMFTTHLRFVHDAIEAPGAVAWADLSGAQLRGGFERGAVGACAWQISCFFWGKGGTSGDLRWIFDWYHEKVEIHVIFLGFWCCHVRFTQSRYRWRFALSYLSWWLRCPMTHLEGFKLGER